jgi:signal transduction histidine kinase/ActR/RegA family two-component response regulator
MSDTVSKKEAQQDNELIQVLFDTSLHCIMVFKSMRDALGKIYDFEFISVNQQTEKFIGKEILPGTTYCDLFPGGKEMGLLDHYIQVIETREPLISEGFYPYDEGLNLERWYKQKVVAYQDGIVIAFEDISPKMEAVQLAQTTKEKAEEVENKYMSLFNSMEQGFCIIEMLYDENNKPCDYRFIETNPSFIQQTGLVDAVGKTIKSMYPHHEQHWFDLYGGVVKSKKSIHFEQEAELINGWFEAHAYPMEDGQNRLAIVFSDITNRKKAEQQAEQERQNALKALKFKQQFLSNMSHEIRTPLTAIIGFTDEITKTELDTTQREYIEAIKVSGDAMLVLVNDILDLAKVNEGKMEFDEHPFHLDACIRNMLLLFDTKIQQKKLSLVKNYDITIPPVLIGDSARINQIIMNLVGNAVKFTNQGKITINVSLMEQSEHTASIVLSVTDTGIGIASADLDKIFDHFQQVGPNTSGLYGGSGLGLSIVKQLAEAQGGSVSVKSEEGKGSAFSVVLKFKKPLPNREFKISPNTDAPTIGQSLKSAKEYNILVAEDVKLNQLLMKVVLTNMGFKPHIAENGMEAVKLVQENDFDLILMDIQMPVMDGYEATATIRNELKLNIPIVALTADVTSTDIEKIKRYGMNDYATKPINQENLYNKIMQVLNKYNNN